MGYPKSKEEAAKAGMAAALAAVPGGVVALAIMEAWQASGIARPAGKPPEMTGVQATSWLSDFQALPWTVIPFGRSMVYVDRAYGNWLVGPNGERQAPDANSGGTNCSPRRVDGRELKGYHLSAPHLFKIINPGWDETYEPIGWAHVALEGDVPGPSILDFPPYSKTIAFAGPVTLPAQYVPAAPAPARARVVAVAAAVGLGALAWYKWPLVAKTVAGWMK